MNNYYKVVLKLIIEFLLDIMNIYQNKHFILLDQYINLLINTNKVASITLVFNLIR